MILTVVCDSFVYFRPLRVTILAEQTFIVSRLSYSSTCVSAQAAFAVILSVFFASQWFDSFNWRLVIMYSEFSPINEIYIEDSLVKLTPCSLVTRYYCFGEARCSRLNWKLEIQTTRRRIPEERDLYRCEKLRSEVRYGEQRSEWLL